MKHRLLKLGLLLLLGAIINIAVAWGCAYWVNAFEHGGVGIQGSLPDSNLIGYRSWLITRRGAFGGTRIIVMPNTGTGSSTPAAANDESTLFPVWCNLRIAMDQRLAEANALAQTTGKQTRPLPIILVADARGWPVRSLMCAWDYWHTGPAPPPNWSSLQSGIELPTYGGAANNNGLDYLRAFPLRIWWPGFAINTLFYAAIVWMLWAGPFKLRRWRRIKRGLCPACAYPTGTSDKCTECGKPVKPQGVERAG